MDKILKEIDDAFSVYNKKLVEISKEMEFQRVCEFRPIKNCNIPYDELKIGGIY